MRSCPTHHARIELGLAPGRRTMTDEAIRHAVAALGLCVSVTPTRYIHANGDEDGLAIGLLDIPGQPHIQRETALGLAKRLLAPAGQHSASVVFPDEHVLVTEDDNWPS